MRLSVVSSAIDAEEAREIVRGAAPRTDASSMRAIFYPYHWFLFRSEKAAISCLVDARTGRGSTSGRFTLDSMDAGAEDVLKPRIAEDEALRCARRAAGNALMNERRALFVPHFDVIASKFVHKRFWVVGCENGPGSFSVLVDGVNGAFHPLAG